MTTKESLSNEEISVLANEWRRKSLRGDLHAPLRTGIAHEFETEIRRRVGAPFPDYDADGDSGVALTAGFATARINVENQA